LKGNCWEQDRNCQHTIKQVQEHLSDDLLTVYRNIRVLQDSLTEEDIHLASTLLRDNSAMPVFVYHLLNTTTYRIGSRPGWPLVIQLWSDEDCDTEDEDEASFYKSIMDDLDRDVLGHQTVVWYNDKISSRSSASGKAFDSSVTCTGNSSTSV